MNTYTTTIFKGKSFLKKDSKKLLGEKIISKIIFNISIFDLRIFCITHATILDQKRSIKNGNKNDSTYKKRSFNPISY